MRDAAREHLKRVEKLKAGQAMLEAYVFGRGTLTGGSAGAGLSYHHRLTRGLSAFATGEVSNRWGNRGYTVFEALLGIGGVF